VSGAWPACSVLSVAVLLIRSSVPLIVSCPLKGKFDPVFTAIQVLGAARTQIAPRQKWVAYVTAKDGRLYIDAAC